MAAEAKKLKKRYDAMEASRGVWNAHFQECAEFVLPSKSEFTGQQTPGNKRMQRLYDSTSVSSNEILAAGLDGNLSNRVTKWFGVRMTDNELNEDDAVKKYLSDVEQIMRAHMYAPGSGLPTALPEVYLELGAFGTASMFIGERSDGGLLFQARPLKEVLIAENNDGEVDTAFRSSQMTVRQIEQQWPGKASPKVLKMLAEKPDEMIKIIHAVMPREDRDYGKKGQDNMPFLSCYFEYETEHILGEGGFPEFPYACPRWQKLPGEVYGRSPAMTALPDIKMLQEMMKTTLKAAQKVVDPPLMVPDDGVIGPVRTVPGGLNFVRGEFEIRPLITGGKIELGLEMMEDLRNRIRTTFYTNILQVQNDKEMTAFETAKVIEGNMRLLGPVAGRLESELLGPIITRVFGILSRRGVLPQPPDVLTEQNNQFTVEYVSPLAMAQKASEANVLDQLLARLLPLAELKPSVFDRIKTDDLAPWLWDLHGGDPDMVIGDEEWQQMQEDKAAQEQAAQAAATAEPIAKAANQGAGAVDKLAGAQQKGADVAGMMEQMKAAA